MKSRKITEYVEPEGLVLEDTVVKINRCATVVKGGRRFSFSALVIVGNGNGVVGWGFGKANEVPPSVEKGVKDARKRLLRVPLVGSSIPHKVLGTFGASKVLLMPARPGTGVLAGAAVRAVCEKAGIHDILTKSYGSNNPVNLVKATFDGLGMLRSKKQAEQLRGVNL
ncbi:MAG: 30S ribosomal protein S5 [Planctomycetota bacterium]|jgi:small subunit ribosomal protein S5